jgi:hypothetical protein
MISNPEALFAGLPGEKLICQGLEDWRAGRCTPAACLVAIGSPRLAPLGLLGPACPVPPTEAEQELYRLLRQEGGDAYSRYNALLRELISFEQSLDRRMRQRLSALKTPSSLS